MESAADRLKSLERSMDAISQRIISQRTDEILNNAKKANDPDVVIGEIQNVDMNLLRKAADTIKSRMGKVIFVLVSEREGKIAMVVGVRGKDDISAVKLLNEIGQDFGIKGGGRLEFAQAGGKSGADIKEILKKADEVIKKVTSVTGG